MKNTLVVSLVLLSTNSFSKDYELEKVIKKAEEKSFALKAADESLQAAEIEKTRSARHWLPQVYLTGQSFVSNDPGTALFGKLSQREIKSSDFMEASLNHPETSLYTKAAIGVNFPLYEGGQKQAISEAMRFSRDAKKLEQKSMSDEFYIEVVKNYFVAKNFTLEKNNLNNVYSTLNLILQNYQVGSKENQLGYSGLLGLKSLKNKISASLGQNQAQLTAVEGALLELTGEKDKLLFSNNTSLEALVSEYLAYSEVNYIPSAKVKSYFENANSAREMIDASKSRNLPRIGLFGEGYAFNGERALAKGYATGINLSWNLFSSEDYGNSQDVVHKSNSAKYFAEASQQKEKIEYEGLKYALSSIKSSLSLLHESEKYLDEQIKISHNLFKNGLINALQYVEVLSRRIDLIKSITEAQNQLIETQSKLAKNSNINEQTGDSQ